MAVIDEIRSDLEALLRPAAGPSSAGTDLDGTLELNALELACAEPETTIVQGVEQEDERNWRQVRTQASELLARSKDLRVAVMLTRALLHQEGIAGFCAGVCFVSELAQRYWEQVYPALDPADGDAVMRINALQEFASRPMLMDLRLATLLEPPGLGKVTLNDLLLAATHPLGKPELVRAPSHVAFAAVDALQGEAQALLQSIREARQALAALVEFVADKTGAFLQLDAILRCGPNGRPGVLDVLDEVLAAELGRVNGGSEPGTSKAEACDSVGQPMAPQVVAEGGQGGGGAGRERGDISRREDVVAMLERICAYYARVEPSSPVPLLLQRAKRLATMEFVDIVRDIADHGLAQVGMVAGIHIPDAPPLLTGSGTAPAAGHGQELDEHGQIY